MHTGPEVGEPRSVRVLVIDDHEMFAESIARVLGQEPDIEVVGVAASVTDGVALAAVHEPDVVVVDWRLPDGDGGSAITGVREVAPSTRALVLTGSEDDRALVAAIDAGCAGFLTKDKAVKELVAAVRLIYAGDAYIPAPMLASLLHRFGKSYRGIGSDLTRRELEILDHLAAGLSNPAIADRLYLSVHTVRNHVQNVLSKLGAHSKLEAVAIAVREGLLPTPR
jgi:DNA-binding NarL/FixJ family response regulator